MKLIFDSVPGVIGAMVDGPGLPFSIAIGGTGRAPAFPSYSQIKAILTGFQYGGRSGLGVSHTLRDRIYVYVFGERMAEATITGVAFAGVCNTARNLTGFDGVLAYYERLRVSAEGTPVRLILGPNSVLGGFMYEFGFQLEDPQTGLGSFSFKFKSPPRNAEFGLLPPVPWDTSLVSIPIAS
jgi:hypothetical protein